MQPIQHKFIWYVYLYEMFRPELARNRKLNSGRKNYFRTYFSIYDFKKRGGLRADSGRKTGAKYVNEVGRNFKLQAESSLRAEFRLQAEFHFTGVTYITGVIKITGVI